MFSSAQCWQYILIYSLAHSSRCSACLSDLSPFIQELEHLMFKSCNVTYASAVMLLVTVTTPVQI